MKLMKIVELEVEGSRNIELSLKMMKGMEGAIPCFENKEDAIAACEGGRFQMLKVTAVENSEDTPTETYEAPIERKRQIRTRKFRFAK